MVLKSPTGVLLLPLPATVDLIKLAASLEVRGVDKKLTGALQDRLEGAVLFADLRQAQGACGALNSLAPAAASLEPGALLHIQSSVLAAAILLYARATTTSSSKRNERGSIHLDLAKLAPDRGLTASSAQRASIQRNLRPARACSGGLLVSGGRGAHLPDTSTTTAPAVTGTARRPLALVLARSSSRPSSRSIPTAWCRRGRCGGP